MTEAMFIPSQYYKELLLLNIVSKGKDVTQRDISASLNVSATMVNNYIDKCEENGFIKRTYYSTKTVKYSITESGEERRKLLYMQYLKSSMDVFNNASIDCVRFLYRLVEKGYKNIYLYGAGEVGEIILYAIMNIGVIGLNVIGIIDDDVNKIGKKLNGVNIVSFDSISDYDGILISSYTNKEIMKMNLTNKKIKKSKILEYL